MQSDLFGTHQTTPPLPLATRMRPRTLHEFVGQAHLLGEGMPIRRAIEQGALGSVILWAPPGCGKTSLAYLIAHYTDAFVEAHSAVTAGVADIRKAAERARQRLKTTGQPTLLLLDEIHHFSRTQQDALLGYLEDGTFTLVGATTENPFLILSNALLSRARVLTLQPLHDAEVRQLIERALLDAERGLGARRLQIAPDAREHLVRCANGDARLALNLLETAALQTPDGGVITLPVIEQLLLAHNGTARAARSTPAVSKTLPACRASALIKSSPRWTRCWRSAAINRAANRRPHPRRHRRRPRRPNRPRRRRPNPPTSRRLPHQRRTQTQHLCGDQGRPHCCRQRSRRRQPPACDDSATTPS